ncbi:TY4B-J [Symbiodinium sp. CCMP2592]|nr:TY4B-J [Symbiodinium sp. CCMP2592]
MGQANCSCKGVSKECLVIIGADAPSEPSSAPAPTPAAAPVAAIEPSPPLSAESRSMQPGPLAAKPRRNSQLSKADRPPPLPLNEKEDDANSVMSQPTSANLPSPPGPPKGGASPGGLHLGQDAKANGHSIKPVKEVAMADVQRAPGPMSPRGAPPPRQMPPAADMNSKSSESPQPKKMPINFREDVAHFAPQSRPAAPAASSGMGAQGLGVVAPVTPDMAARLLAYKERQERKGKKKQGIAGQANAANFLSQVPEVERDIPLRFMFEISGGMHERLVHAACDSEQALAMYNGVSEGAPKKEEPDAALIQKMYRSGSSGFLPHTCLCEVPWSVAETAAKKRASSKVRLAKLSFRALTPGKLTKACNSQSDAESSCTVFMIHVDEAPTMRERLVIMEEAVVNLMESVPPTRRPIPAVFLVCSTRERTDQMDRAWKKILEDYEADKGELLKFGPVCLDDGDAIHQAFADLATARVHAQEKGFTSKEIWQKFNLASRNNVSPWPLVALPEAPMRSSATKSSLGSWGSIAEGF